MKEDTTSTCSQCPSNDEQQSTDNEPRNDVQLKGGLNLPNDDSLSDSEKLELPTTTRTVGTEIESTYDILLRTTSVGLSASQTSSEFTFHPAVTTAHRTTLGH